MCVRIDSYETKEHQAYVRTFLNGRFENSAFCLLAPNGQDWLTRAGRGPEMVLGHRSSVIRMKTVAAQYAAKDDVKQAIVQDFHSVRQALNVASADQRVLVLVSGSKVETDNLRSSLRSVSNDDRIIGRFHFDFDEGDEWRKTVTGNKAGPGIVAIRPGEFGLDGSVMKQLSLSADSSEIITTLLAANSEFAKTTKKKVYSSHVSRGNKLGVYFESVVPYGEDRDGDGRIDHLGGKGARPLPGSRPRP
ncbi:MAG: hypothetical protein O3B13_13395 [Planctomycetota bacterium]|nr:hypothetical protein [Planctomycetota bacterium]MDA1164095.1 hypothetical protein [Planctomycetota bacterium]